MEHIDFYNEKKFCRKCKGYVRFLMSIYHSYCIDCGTIVSLFSKQDKKKFLDEKNKPTAKGKPGRKRKTTKAS